MPLKTVLSRFPCLLTEGAVIERVRRESALALHPSLANTTLLLSEEGRALLKGFYRQYLRCAREARLPLLLLTPTWRASLPRLEALGLGSRHLPEEACRFMRSVYEDEAPAPLRPPVLLAGLLGCQGDAYEPREALSAGEAERYHRGQAEALVDGGCDLLLAATLPALSEAEGMARALAASGAPYVLSFIIRPNGRLLDGTLLSEACERLDYGISRAPLGYMVNCVHADPFRQALELKENQAILDSGRLLGLQANTSSLPPEALNESQILHGMAPADFGQALLNLHLELGLPVLGGCCGTDHRHIGALAKALAEHYAPASTR